MLVLCLIIIPVSLSIGGMLIVYGICRMVAKKTQENWVDLKGRIQSIDVKRRVGKRRYDVYTVCYLYEMNGAEYHKQFVLNANKYAVNGELQLRVDPDNPARHLIMSEAGDLDSAMKKLITGIVLTLAGLYFGPQLCAELPWTELP